MTTILHIGLPKTATTFWQYRIFSRSAEIEFIHRNQEDPHGVCRAIRRVCQRGESSLGPRNRDKVRTAGERLGRLTEKASRNGRPVLISDENISVGARTFWTGEGPDPETVAGRLKAFLIDRAGLAREEIRILIGVRSQGRWLASRYAQSRLAHFRRDPEEAKMFCQENFDRRLGEIANGAPLTGSYLWLDHAHVAQAFARVFGPGVTFMLPIEALDSKPEATIRNLQSFVGCGDFADIYADGDGENMRNRLSTGPAAWKFGDGELVLDPELEKKIDNRFSCREGIRVV